MTSTPPLISNKKRAHERTTEMVTVVFSARSSFPIIRGQWERLPNGRILATYTRDELARCIRAFEAMNEPGDSA